MDEVRIDCVLIP